MFFQISRSTVLLLLGLLLGVFVAPQQAQSSNKSDLQVQVSLISNSTFSLGEPIVLKYQILNTSSERAETYMGKGQRGWVTETLSDAQGHAITFGAEQSPHQNGGAHVDGISVSPMSSAAGYVVFNPWTTIHTAGKYKLTVHTQLPYGLGAQAEEVAPDKYEAFGNVAASDFTFSLNITPHTSGTLKQAAEMLRQSVADAKLQDWSSAAVEALISMPEADVSSVWEEMISDPAVPRYALGFAADQLVRLHSITASDLVAHMRWEPARPLEAGESPIGAAALDEMSQLGDAELRKHIERLYASHGEARKYSMVVAD